MFQLLLAKRLTSHPLRHCPASDCSAVVLDIVVLSLYMCCQLEGAIQAGQLASVPQDVLDKVHA